MRQAFLLLISLFSFLFPLLGTALTCSQALLPSSPNAKTHSLAVNSTAISIDVNRIDLIVNEGLQRIHRLLNTNNFEGESPEFIFGIMLHASSKPGLSESELNQLRGYFRYPLIIDQTFHNISIDLNALPREIKSRWLNFIKDTFKKHIENHQQHNHFSREYSLNALFAMLRTARTLLSESELTDYSRLLSLRLSKEWSNDIMEGIYPPKVYQFAKQTVRRVIGASYIPLTDLVAIRHDETRIGFYVLSVEPTNLRVDPITDLKKTWGLDFRKVKEINTKTDARTGSKLAYDEVTWRVGGKHFRAEYEIIAGPRIESIAPAIRQLDFVSMWKDHKLSGLIFPAVNMGLGIAGSHYVMDAYAEYYQANGYNHKTIIPIKDFKSFVQKLTESGELDYMLKEAHSGGSDAEIAEVVNEGMIHRYTKKLKGNKSEVVYLYYPNRNLIKREVSIPIDFQSFSEWMKERSRNSSAQLLYIDTQCYGLNSAANLVTAVATNKLVVSGSDSIASTFTYDQGTALMHILNGLRNGSSFAQIRKDMEKNSEAYREEHDDTYRFPDSREWMDTVRKNINRSFHTQVQVFDQNNRPINIENMAE